MSKIPNLRYCDPKFIDGILHHTGGIPKQRLRGKGFDLSANPAAKWSSTDASDDIILHEKIDLALERLHSKGRLLDKRPSRNVPHDWQSDVFIYEKCAARQFILRNEFAKRLPGVGGMKVWISDPNASEFEDKEWSWAGSYLFLTELRFDNIAYESFISGRSALRLLIESFGVDELPSSSNPEPYGRWDQRSVSEKLMSVGFTPGLSHAIQTLYRLRYMTDEQYHRDAPQDGRVHDILGYPVFIAD